MAYANKIVVPIVFFLVAGFFFLSKSETSFAGVTPGCCITNGNQCSPSCGPQGSSCQNPGTGPNPFARCPEEILFGDVKDCGTLEVGCHVLGAVCFQVESNVGVCLAEPPPTPTPTPNGPTPTPLTGCCGESAFFFDCQGGVTPEQCAQKQGEFASDGSCQLDNSCFPPSPIPTMSEWGGIITAGLLGLIGIYFAARRFALRRSS